MVRFIFDLDGTVTAEETLPLIASHFEIEEIKQLTQETIAGNIPFIDSFIRRVHILSQYPVSEVNNLLEDIRLYASVLEFIHMNKERCVIATGNLSCWVESLLMRIGVESYTSSAIVENDKVLKINTILQKEEVVRKFKERGETVVFIGEGNNDVESMRLADVSIASGLTHTPAKSILSIADYLVFEEGALCRLLNQLS